MKDQQWVKLLNEFLLLNVLWKQYIFTLLLFHVSVGVGCFYNLMKLPFEGHTITSRKKMVLRVDK